MTQRDVGHENKKFIALRYIDIAIYCFTAWLMYYCIGKYTSLTKIIDWWRDVHYLLSNEVTFAILLLSGALTKYILINCRDSTPSRITKKNTNVRIKETPLAYFEKWFESICNIFKNPPLSTTIFLSVSMWIFFNGYDIILDSFYPYMIAYCIGWFLPLFHTNKEPSIYQSNQDGHKNINSRIQNELPLVNKSDDTLNREHIVERISTILRSKDVNDARGIAIIGPFGIGKSSLINMSINDALEKSKRNIICRLDTWGTYESDEQIQRFIIEEMVNSISELTSSTHLIGLSSRYITSLKGAQSFWLDTLPLLYNHSSATSQLKKIDSTLSLMRYHMILVIEDIDRNSHANDILNGIAPLLDRLNHQSTIKLIISIGEKFNNPDVINRVCRYKEFLHYNHMDTHGETLTLIKELSSYKKFKYIGNVEDFFIEDDSSHTQARNSLFSHITSQRDLNFILREVELSWNNFLAGQCDILDLLAITIIKHFEPNLIGAISEYNEVDDEVKNKENLMLHLKNYNLLKVKDATLIFEYFFMKNRVTYNRLQACSLYKSYYLPMLIERKSKFKNYDKPDDHYFNHANKIQRALGHIKNADDTINIMKRYCYMARIKSHDKIMYDLSILHGKGESSLLKLILIYWDIKDGLSRKYNVTTFGDALKNVDLHRVKNQKLASSLTEGLSQLLIQLPISHVLSFYKALKYSKNIEIALKPSIDSIFLAAKNEYESSDSNSKYIADMLSNMSELIYTLWGHDLSKLAEKIEKRSGDFETDLYEYIINYVKYPYGPDLRNVVSSIKNHFHSLDEPI